MTADSPWPVTLTLPADVPVIAGCWHRLADGRIQTTIQRHELKEVLKWANEIIPQTVAEHLSAARQAPAPVTLPPEPPAPPEPPEEPRPDAVDDLTLQPALL